MFTTQKPRSLSRRGSKLLVEMIIGVIGILGIMLAQNSDYADAHLQQLASEKGQIVQNKVVGVSQKVDWLEILF